MKTFNLIKWIILGILSMSLLTGCGFHLRGKLNLPPALHTFYLDGNSPYSTLLLQIRKTLNFSNITTVDSPTKAPVTLFVLTDSLTYNQSTIGTSDSLRNYTVNYNVSYELRSPTGQKIAGPFSVSSTQTITAMEGELLDNSNKLAQVKKELQQDTVSKMMFQIASQETIEQLTKATKKNSLNHST